MIDIFFRMCQIGMFHFERPPFCNFSMNDMQNKERVQLVLSNIHTWAPVNVNM